MNGDKELSFQMIPEAGGGSWGIGMLLRDYGYPADFSDGRSTRDTIDGFALIAAGLEGGVDVIQGNSKIGDALAICLGWLMLAAVIFYPTVQLVAVGVCIALMCMRPFVQHAFGVGKRLG